jgi:hypothetical protein
VLDDNQFSESKMIAIFYYIYVVKFMLCTFFGKSSKTKVVGKERGIRMQSLEHKARIWIRKFFKNS